MPTPVKTLTLLATLVAAQSFAQASTNDLAAARARYKQEVAACAAAKPAVNKRTCLKEARNTLAEFKRGKMPKTRQSVDFANNALLRCEAHKGDDKADCVARMHGQGKIEGSVAGGGILRELTTTTVIAPPPVVQASAPKAPEGPRPSGLMSNCRWIPPLEWACK